MWPRLCLDLLRSAPSMARRAIKKVLVVDDDDTVLAAFQRGLNHRHKVVYTTTDPDDALKIARADEPDLAIVDMRLKASNGIDLIRILKRNHPRLKVVLMSGYLSIESAFAAAKAGADLVAFKPATVQEVLERIEGKPISHEEGASLARIEYEHLHRVLADTNGNVSKAARVLKIHRHSLQRKLKKPLPKA